LTLVARLERPLPATLPESRATALFCTGICFDSEQPIAELRIVVDGIPYAPAAFAMPRPDVAEEDGHPGPPERRRLSGFWGTVPILARERPGTVRVGLSARLADGSRTDAELGVVQVPSPAGPPALAPRPAAPGGPLIAVCLATFEPDPALFGVQLESLRAQTDERWVCVISDDCSSPEHYERILAGIGGDERFAVSRSERRLGFYRNFERALELAPAQAELIALCDQDDRWHPDKLQTLRGALGSATLVYSDQRLVEADGTRLRDTMWQGRRNNRSDLASMLVANTITGAATLFTRELLQVALPFPDTPGFQFHDHWIALVALAAGEVAYVERPLYDYVQHAGAVFGDVTHGSRDHAGSRLRAALRGPWPRTNWRAAYFFGYLPREAQARVLLARLDGRLSAAKQRALERFVACERTPAALAWLVARGIRASVGTTATLGSELELARGVVWKMLAAARAKTGVAGIGRGPFADARVPPPQEFSQRRLRRWRARL
jgi:glycosyltransferase involved in cell wall biosynthesis